MRLRGAHENLNKGSIHYQRRRCSPMTVVSVNIRFMHGLCGYSQGFPGEVSSNDSGVIQNFDFSVFSDARSSET